MTNWKNSPVLQRYKEMKKPSRILCIITLSIPFLLLFLPEAEIKARPWEQFSWKEIEYPISCQNLLLEDGFYEGNNGDLFFEFYYSSPNFFYMNEKQRDIPFEDIFCHPIAEPSNVTPVR